MITFWIIRCRCSLFVYNINYASVVLLQGFSVFYSIYKYIKCAHAANKWLMEGGGGSSCSQWCTSEGREEKEEEGWIEGVQSRAVRTLWVRASWRQKTPAQLSRPASAALLHHQTVNTPSDDADRLHEQHFLCFDFLATHVTSQRRYMSESATFLSACVHETWV